MTAPVPDNGAEALAAFALIAEGTGRVPALGELIGVDVGGATTDVYSVAGGRPTTPRSARSSSAIATRSPPSSRV